jgi:hypothetical protein
MAFWVINIPSSVNDEVTIYTFFAFKMKLKCIIYAIVPETDVKIKSKHVNLVKQGSKP